MLPKRILKQSSIAVPTRQGESISCFCDFPEAENRIFFAPHPYNQVLCFNLSNNSNSLVYNGLPNESIAFLTYAIIPGESGQLILVEKIHYEDNNDRFYLVGAALENRKFVEDIRIRLRSQIVNGTGNTSNNNYNLVRVAPIGMDRLICGFQGGKSFDVFLLKPLSRTSAPLELGFKYKSFTTINSQKPPLLVVIPSDEPAIRILRIRGQTTLPLLETFKTISQVTSGLMLWLPRHDLLMVTDSDFKFIRGWRVKDDGSFNETGTLFEITAETQFSSWNSLDDNIAVYDTNNSNLHLLQIEYVSMAHLYSI